MVDEPHVELGIDSTIDEEALNLVMILWGGIEEAFRERDGRL